MAQLHVVVVQVSMRKLKLTLMVPPNPGADPVRK